MREVRLKSSRFREEREDDWRKLERLLRRLEKPGGAAQLSDDELIAVPVLYRATLSSLSVARATSLDKDLTDYLESLATRAYFHVYGVRTSLRARVARFFAEDWPAAARALWRETLVAALLTAFGAVAAYVLVSQDPDWFYSFIPADLASGRDPSASAEFLRETLYAEPEEREGLSVFATFLFTHNAQVCILAFALGFALCLPTALLTTYTGCMLGAFFALYGRHGLGFELGGWLLIHGVTEILAATLSGAAGFKIGTSLAFPGRRSRMEAMSEAGRQAAILMAGVVVMLMVAGVLEGFGRQLIRNDGARYAIAAISAVVWGAYLYAPRRERRLEPADG
jgi:uncharacterized membrane protein SpoIIM required for sporulation